MQKNKNKKKVLGEVLIWRGADHGPTSGEVHVEGMEVGPNIRPIRFPSVDLELLEFPVVKMLVVVEYCSFCMLLL